MSHNGASAPVLPSTSSMTSSVPMPSSKVSIALRSLPHCMLRSFSGFTIWMRWRYIFLAARAMSDGVA